MTQRVLITGSAGHVGRALVAAYRAQGDEVIGLDLPGTGADIEQDLDEAPYRDVLAEYDIAILNAKCKTWQSHYMIAQRASSCVVAVSSIYGVIGCDPKMYEDTEVPPTPAWYAYEKGGMIALTKHMATTLAPVRSNCVIIGGIERGHSDEFKRRYCAKVPLKRMATEQDAVEAIMWLASERAAYVNGHALVCDGGLSVCA